MSILKKNEDKDRTVMIRLSHNQDFIDWFDAIIRGNIIHLRKLNDTEPNEIKFRLRQGAIQAFRNIIEDFNKAPEDLKRGENQAKSEA